MSSTRSVMMLRSITLSIGLCVAVSCAAQTAVVADSSVIRTDKDLYRAVVTDSTVKLTVVATFTNTTRDTLTLHPCAQTPPYPLTIDLQRKEGEVWRTVVSPICTLVLMLNPPRLLPGQSRTDTLQFSESRLPSMFPRFPAGPVAGLYRLAYFEVYRRWYPENPPPGARGGPGEPLAASLLKSNPFRVIEQ
jgi:hypothetical protein